MQVRILAQHKCQRTAVVGHGFEGPGTRWEDSAPRQRGVGGAASASNAAATAATAAKYGRRQHRWPTPATRLHASPLPPPMSAPQALKAGAGAECSRPPLPPVLSLVLEARASVQDPCVLLPPPQPRQCCRCRCRPGAGVSERCSIGPFWGSHHLPHAPGRSSIHRPSRCRNGGVK